MIIKNRKRILAFLLVIMMAFQMVPSTYAAPVSATVNGQAGKEVQVKFTYKNVAAINGVFTYSNPELFTASSLSATGLTSGMYNPDNGYVAYFGPFAVDCTLVLTLQVAANAQVGDRCVITFEYETTEDGNMPTVPEYQYDRVTVVVEESIDYSALQAQIAKAEALQKSDYTALSWAKLESALKTAKDALNSKSQATVDNATKVLADAIAGLQLLTTGPQIDYSELNKQIKIAEGLKKADYTAASWNDMQKALTEAKKALSSTSQTTVDQAASNLKKAIMALEKVGGSTTVDYTELKRQIAIAEGLKESNYTAVSWRKLQNALSAAKAALKSSNQSTVDNAAAELAGAIASLEWLANASVDYTELQRQVAIAEGLHEMTYTSTSWTALQEALAAAREALTSKSQSEVDAAAAALKVAIANLVRVDYSALIAAMEAVKENEQIQSFADLWEKLAALLQRAEILLKGNDQEAINQCAQELTQALAELISRLDSLQKEEPVYVEVPVETLPSDNYCNIGVHRVWPVLFWISLALNAAIAGFIVMVIVKKKQKKQAATNEDAVAEVKVGEAEEAEAEEVETETEAPDNTDAGEE